MIKYKSTILGDKEKGKKFWWRWIDRLGSYYNEKFSPDWQNGDKEF